MTELKQNNIIKSFLLKKNIINKNTEIDIDEEYIDFICITMWLPKIRKTTRIEEVIFCLNKKCPIIKKIDLKSNLKLLIELINFIKNKSI